MQYYMCYVWDEREVTKITKNEGAPQHNGEYGLTYGNDDREYRESDVEVGSH